MKIVEVYAEKGKLAGTEWLKKAEPVHRQLRPHLPGDYMEKMGRILENARMALAVESDAVVGLAVYRWHENTSDGVKFYVDDLVTDERHRCKGVGHALIEHLEAVARNFGANCIMLDSGTQRTRAHRFYFREGFAIPAFNFKKSFS
ncbi:MAG: GNAT family N-acetyltransferase [Gallionella sp.]